VDYIVVPQQQSFCILKLTVVVTRINRIGKRTKALKRSIHSKRETLKMARAPKKKKKRRKSATTKKDTKKKQPKPQQEAEEKRAPLEKLIQNDRPKVKNKKKAEKRPSTDPKKPWSIHATTTSSSSAAPMANAPAPSAPKASISIPSLRREIDDDVCSADSPDSPDHSYALATLSYSQEDDPLTNESEEPMDVSSSSDSEPSVDSTV